MPDETPLQYAKKEGMHAKEMAKYASFPEDIIAEWSQAIKKRGILKHSIMQL
jgi:hypothetical protein